MVTVALVGLVVLLVVIAVAGIVGGIAMMFEKDACVFSWYMGQQAISGGFQILAAILPAILSAIVESNN